MLKGPAGDLQLHHGLPRGVVVDEVGAAQLLVVVMHHQVLTGLLPLEVGVVGFPGAEMGVGSGRGVVFRAGVSTTQGPL